MCRGFPVAMIAWLRCHHDGGTLSLRPGIEPSQPVQQGTLRCTTCNREYAIEDGIVRLLDPSTLDAESSHERLCRDEQAGRAEPALEASAWDRMEIEPALAACEPLAGARVLELGAGTGRHTLPMLRRGAAILAVDFSIASLRLLAARIQPDWEIGLVHGDCTQIAVEPGSFDVVASTLVSNLPTRRHRAAMMRVASRSCRSSGRFVFGTHHYGLRSILTREARSGYYDSAPIYRYLFRPREIEAETLHYFRHASCHPIQIRIPFAARVGLPVLTLSRLTERVPLVNELGALLLVVAREPILGSASDEGSDDRFETIEADETPAARPDPIRRISSWRRALALRG